MLHKNSFPCGLAELEKANLRVRSFFSGLMNTTAYKRCFLWVCFGKQPLLEPFVFETHLKNLMMKLSIT